VSRTVDQDPIWLGILRALVRDDPRGGLEPLALVAGCA
jgi:hypothetical protein